MWRHVEYLRRLQLRFTEIPSARLPSPSTRVPKSVSTWLIIHSYLSLILFNCFGVAPRRSSEGRSPHPIPLFRVSVISRVIQLEFSMPYIYRWDRTGLSNKKRIIHKAEEELRAIDRHQNLCRLTENSLIARLRLTFSTWTCRMVFLSVHPGVQRDSGVMGH